MTSMAAKPWEFIRFGDSHGPKTFRIYMLWAELPEVLATENLVRAQRGMSEVAQPSPSWRYLLTDRQATCLSLHEKHWGGATLMEHYVDLSQSLRFARPRTVIPTMRRSASRIWSWKCERWLLPSEYAAAMAKFHKRRFISWRILQLRLSRHSYELWTDCQWPRTRDLIRSWGREGAGKDFGFHVGNSFPPGTGIPRSRS